MKTSNIFTSKTNPGVILSAFFSLNPHILIFRSFFINVIFKLCSSLLTSAEFHLQCLRPFSYLPVGTWLNLFIVKIWSFKHYINNWRFDLRRLSSFHTILFPEKDGRRSGNLAGCFWIELTICSISRLGEIIAAGFHSNPHYAAAQFYPEKMRTGNAYGNYVVKFL